MTDAPDLNPRRRNPRRRMPSLAFALAALAVVAALLLRPLLRDRPDAEHSVPVVDEGSAPQGVELERAREPAEHGAPVGAAPHPGERTPATEPPALLALEGPVAITDRDGVPRPSVKGYVEWRIHAADGTLGERKTRIVDDRWSIEVSSDAVLEPIAVLWSDGVVDQHAIPTAELVPARQADGHTLRAVLEYGFALNVVDAETREHVSEAHVVLAGRTESWSGDTRSPPEELERSGVLVDGDSPLAMPHLPGTRVGWARAPGYAWRRFAFSGKDGELTVPLHRGVDVDVVVHGLPPDHPNPRLVVRSLPGGDAPAEREPVAEVGLAPRGRATLLGLPAGTTEFQVVAAFGNTSAPSRLGQVRETLRPGPRALVVIDLDAPEVTAAYGTLDVVVRGAASMTSRMKRIEVHGVDDGRPPQAHYFHGATCDEDGSYRWTSAPLPEGEYVVVVQPGSLSRAATVSGGTVTPVEIDTANTVLVTVRVIDPDTGRRLGSPNYAVGYRPRGTSGGAAWDEVTSRADRTYAFRCVPGPITLGAWPCGGGSRPMDRAQPSGPATSRVSAVRDVVVPPEGLDLEIPLPRVHLLPFRVRALQGEDEVFLPLAFWTTLDVTPIPPAAGVAEEVEFGTAQVASLGSMDATFVTVRVTQPGR
jgi:hypothetical protein